MPHYGRVSLIAASPNDAASAYAAVKNYQMDDRKPYIYRTHDYGKTWTAIVNGIPANDFVQAIREDTVRKGLLFAGTEHGIYVSFDDGDNWQSIRLNLPDVQVRTAPTGAEQGEKSAVFSTRDLLLAKKVVIAEEALAKIQEIWAK